jgi:hypothetical protein
MYTQTIHNNLFTNETKNIKQACGKIHSIGNLEARKLVLDGITALLPTNMDLLMQKPCQLSFS